MTILCDSLCAKVVKRKNLSWHKLFECSKAQIECDLCKQKFQRDQLRFHKESECIETIMNCSLNCGTKITRRQQTVHIIVCPEWIMTCDQNCREFVKRRDLEKHKLDVCIKSKLKCDKCKAEFERKDYNIHKDSQNCPEEKRECSLKCRSIVAVKDAKVHLETACPFGIVECIFKCGRFFSRNMAKIHAQACHSLKISSNFGQIEPKGPVKVEANFSILSNPIVTEKQCVMCGGAYMTDLVFINDCKHTYCIYCIEENVDLGYRTPISLCPVQGCKATINTAALGKFKTSQA